MSFESAVKRRIKDLRRAQSLSQEDLARRIGTTNQHIGRLEKLDGGAHLSLDWVEKLAAGLGAAPETILLMQPAPAMPNKPSLFSDYAIPHRGLARCGVSGWGRPEPRDPLPAPANLNDPDAFYVQATGRSMEPEGIRTGDTVLVSPSAHAEVGGRVYVEDREGRGSIKRVVDLNGKTIRLRGWRPDGGSFKDFVDERQLDYVTVLAPVIAVFERKPEVGELEQRKADPRRPDDVLGTVPLLGFAAAGNDVVFDTAIDDGTRVAPPPGGGVSLGAISVRGSSMAPMARDGDTIYIDISRPFAPADCIGKPVIARDRDGGTYLKTLRRGDDAKRWNLESADLRYETMTNVDIAQVFPVRWIALSKSA